MSERPTFGFGNSEHSQCVSTCYVHVPTEAQQMSLKVHALDQGSAPILVSVATLRKLGAIIDFRTDEAVFTAVNDRTLVKLKRSTTGHQDPTDAGFFGEWHDSHQSSDEPSPPRRKPRIGMRTQLRSP